MRTSPEEAGCCRERSSRTHTFNYLCSDPKQAFSPKTNLQKNLERAQPVPKRSPQSRAASSWDASHPNERPQPVSKSVPQPRLQRTSARDQLGQIFQKLDKFSPFETSSPPRLLRGKFSLILCLSLSRWQGSCQTSGWAPVGRSRSRSWCYHTLIFGYSPWGTCSLPELRLGALPRSRLALQLLLLASIVSLTYHQKKKSENINFYSCP